MSRHNELIHVYGFGSYFDESLDYGDIDLLIVHENLSVASCQSAIICKRKVIDLCPCAHITMLSVREEGSISFIARSRATILGSIFLGTLEFDIKRIVCAIGNLSTNKIKRSGVNKVLRVQHPHWPSAESITTNEVND